MAQTNTRPGWELKIARTMAHLHGPHGFIMSLPFRTGEEKSDAAFIIRACNSHADLVEDLQYIDETADIALSELSKLDESESIELTITAGALVDILRHIGAATK